MKTTTTLVNMLAGNTSANGMVNGNCQRGIQSSLLDHMGAGGYGNSHNDTINRKPIMRICIDCNYIGTSTHDDYHLCPRCYKQNRVGKMLTQEQLVVTTRSWARIYEPMAKRRQEQIDMLKQHIESISQQ